MFKTTCVIAALLGSSSVVHAQALFWENGNFLRPQPEQGSFAIVDTGERFGTWRVVGAPGSIEMVSGTYRHDGFSFPAEGTKPSETSLPWVNLAAISRSVTGFAHEPVPTVVGESYTLTYYVGNVVDPGGIYGTSSTVNVYENSRLIQSATNSSGAGSTTENWQFFTVTFVADAPWTTIVFMNGDPSNDMNCGISNTLLAPVTPAGIAAAKAAHLILSSSKSGAQ
jgi:hypothetical protein